MSKFQVKNWWKNSDPTQGALHNGDAFLVAGFSATEPWSNLVLSGNLDGQFCIYAPSAQCFEPIFKEDLGQPILQLALGKFLGDEYGQVIAILCSRRLILASVRQGESVTFNKLHDTELPEHAYNMVTLCGEKRLSGDEICVQTCEGKLLFVKERLIQSTNQFQINESPGPLCHVSNSNFLVTALQYKAITFYNVENLLKANQSSSQAPQKSAPRRSVKFEDFCLDIKSTATNIVVLGKTRLLILNAQTQEKLYEEHLNYAPTAIHIYNASYAEDRDENLVIVDSRSLVTIKRSSGLTIWAAKVDLVPVSVSVGSFQTSPRGVLTFMDQHGSILVGYLGTKSTKMSEKRLQEMAAFNSATLEQEMEELLMVKSFVSEKATKSMPMISGTVELLNFSASSKLEGDALHLSFNFALKNQFPSNLGGVKVMCDMSSHILTIDNLLAGKPHFVTYNFTMKQLPKSLKSTMAISSDMGQTFHDVRVPVELLGHYQSTVLELSGSLLQLSCSAPTDDFRDKKSFKFHLEPIVCGIQANRSNITLHSPRQADLWLLVQDLALKAERTKSQLSYEGQFLFEELFKAIDLHLQARITCNTVNEQLSRLAKQLIFIEKRLLSRCSEKVPVSLECYSVLLEETMVEMTEACRHQESAFEQLRSASYALQRAVSLTNSLTRASLKQPESDGALEQTIPADVNSFPLDVGWEEIVDANICQQLKTTLAKSDKDRSVQIPRVEMSPDAERFKKHLLLFYDRIRKQ